jgi:hypothetical protein
MKFIYFVAITFISLQSFGQDTIVQPDFYPSYQHVLKLHEPFLTQAKQNEMLEWDSFQFYLFNRWGELVAESKKVNFKIEDILKFEESSLQKDVYVWKIELKMASKEDKEYIGHVTYLGHVH